MSWEENEKDCEEAPPQPVKVLQCPLSQQPCLLNGCGWFVSLKQLCALVVIAQSEVSNKQQERLAQVQGPAQPHAQRQGNSKQVKKCNRCGAEVYWNTEWFKQPRPAGITMFINLDGTPHYCKKDRITELMEKGKKCTTVELAELRELIDKEDKK
jgi:hypothetical protein